MQFPVYVTLGSWQIHPHRLFEAIAYFVALRLLLQTVRKTDTVTAAQRTSVIVGGLVGAFIGAKVLVLVQHLDMLWMESAQILSLLLQGKTVVGAMLGGVIGVELTKALLGVKSSTGDAFVYPLIVGTLIGRIGCFLTGLSDRTYGVATTLPWGIDFGDGILRHPTQLYEMAFLLSLILFLKVRERYRREPGDLFKFYMIAYLGFRLGIDFIKPDFRPWLGLSAIQVACLLGLVYYARSMGKLLTFAPRPRSAS